MKKTQATQKTQRINEARVLEKTGKSWDEWFAILDQFDVKKNGHKAAAQYLYDEYGCPGWWSQMVTVTYEQEHGLREKHQKPDGYEVSASKTVAVPLAKLYKAWQNERVRHQWLTDSTFTVRKATPNKSIRLIWSDGKTSVDVNFYAKDESKSQVIVQHTKLKSSKDVSRMKAYWADQLDRLKGLLEA